MFNRVERRGWWWSAYCKFGVLYYKRKEKGCGGGEPCGRVGGGGQPLRRGRAIGHRGLRMIVERHLKCYADTEVFGNSQDALIFLVNL